ncbi:HIT family protein [Allochromatium palmeri]|uniref:HIT domain-containing protein n=1 Tax=Allochromatium palmeri TaxID=231048 RepID=A0A6N8EGU7_9GAMM|nr:HIT family protein [Allochromatium palmeri]MTW22298.1 HIT domain-containing protein [Allochromatium palmeri]
MNHCLFCQIQSGQRPASIVHRDACCMAFMDLQPINPGHVLVIPNRHAPGLAELDEEIGAHLFRTAQRIAAALRLSEIDAEGVNFFLADGGAAGQEVFHIHLHVFPRYQGDGFRLRFGPGYPTKPTRSALDETAALIRNHLRVIDTEE